MNGQSKPRADAIISRAKLARFGFVSTQYVILTHWWLRYRARWDAGRGSRTRINDRMTSESRRRTRSTARLRASFFLCRLPVARRRRFLKLHDEPRWCAADVDCIFSLCGSPQEIDSLFSLVKTRVPSFVVSRSLHLFAASSCDYAMRRGVSSDPSCISPRAYVVFAWYL